METAFRAVRATEVPVLDRLSLSPFDLIGGVALLLWGLHMVQSGIMRGFGADVRRLLGTALGSRLKGFLAGVTVTALLQSSTATALLTTALAGRGLIALVPALAIVLGANVGTTVIVQILSFDIAAVAPVLVAAGVLAFKKSGKTRTRDLGRAAIGLGLVLLSLRLLMGALVPLSQAPMVPMLLETINQNPILCVIVAALLSWLAHSSVAVVLLIMSFAAVHLLAPAAVLALIAGANLGSAINPLLESSGSEPVARRLPVGNLLNRALGVLMTVAVIEPLTVEAARLQPDLAKLAAAFHVFFNMALAIIFLPLLGPLAAFLKRAMPDTARPADPYAVAYLDPTALATPSVAIACASREALHAADIVEAMLRDSMTALMTNDRKLVSAISRMDNAVDRLDEAIKLYITQVTRQTLDPHDSRRAMEVLAFSINLEHIGDIIDKSLMELAAKKIKRKLQFSKEGAAEIEAFHRRVLETLKLAYGVFMSSDVGVARRLVRGKQELRLAETAAAESHLDRLRQGRLESIETSSLHLDIIRDLRRIHSHVCSVAYPVLDGGSMHNATGDIRVLAT